MRSLICFFLLTSAILAGCAAPSAEITGDSVAHLVSTLADDSMEGRRAGSPGIQKAAAFLEEQFKDIGLAPIDGENGFRQGFNAFQLTTQSSDISLDGSTVPPNDIFFLSSSDSLSWTTGDVEIVRIGPEDDLGIAFGRLRRAPHDLLVLVHSANEPLFRRLQLFLSEGSRMLEMGTTGTVAFVLTDNHDVETIQANATFKVDTLALTNLVGKIEGNRASEIVLFSAHYDHLGIRPPVEGDSIANGANDDASGVAAVLELARYFKASGKPERTIMFALFTAEEMGGYGSHYFADQVDPDQIVAMLNIEMIGKTAESGPNTAWITGFERSDLGEILQRAVEGTEYSFHPDPYPMQNLFFRSDNATLARMGVPAHSISTTPIRGDEDYHQVSDEFETLNVENMVNTIWAVAAGAATIISGTETPSRIELAPAGH